MLPAPLVSVVTSKNPGRAVLCSAPVKLVLSLPNSLSGWMDSGVVGQLAVVKDAELDTIFFQIYDLNTLEQRLDFEAYEDMAYTVPAGFPRLHTFEMEDCVAGLCFCDDDAAQTVAACVAPALPRSGTRLDALRSQGVVAKGKPPGPAAVVQSMDQSPAVEPARQAGGGGVASKLKKLFGGGGKTKPPAQPQSQPSPQPTPQPVPSVSTSSLTMPSPAVVVAVPPPPPRRTSVRPPPSLSSPPPSSLSSPSPPEPESGGTPAAFAPALPPSLPLSSPPVVVPPPPFRRKSVARRKSGVNGEAEGGEEGDWLRALRSAGIRKSQLLDPKVVAALAGVLATEKAAAEAPGLPVIQEADASAPSPAASESIKSRISRRMSKMFSGPPAAAPKPVSERVLEDATRDISPVLAAKKTDIVRALGLLTEQGGFKLKPVKSRGGVSVVGVPATGGKAVSLSNLLKTAFEARRAMVKPDSDSEESDDSWND